MLSAGDVVSLTIEKPAAGGWMIGRIDRMVVLVAGAIPGERVLARIDRVGKGVAYASTVEVADASPDRRDVDADPSCGGCLYAHIGYARQLQLKALVIEDALARIGRIRLDAPVAVEPSPEEGYRMRARLHARGGRAGFYREGTHELCDARQTRQLLPATMDVIDTVLSTLGALAPEALQNLRELEVSENLDASQRGVHLGLVSGTPSPGDAVFDQLAAIRGVTGVSSPGRGRGDPHVVDVLRTEGRPEIALRRHVLSFFQGNRHLLSRLVDHVVDRVPAGSTAIDLYAGVGLFAIAAAAWRDARVVAVEGDPIAAADLAANASAAEGVEPVHRSVEEFVAARGAPKAPSGSAPAKSAARDADILIVDPPRTGISSSALDAIGRMAAVPRLIYVSCDVATFARDARVLTGHGYAIDGLQAFDLFPNTPHVETVAVFLRT